MRILSTKDLPLPGIKVVRFGRFLDQRGYFSETFRRSACDSELLLAFLKGVRFVQCNESYSSAGTLRGLHFQWEPHMGKLVRTIQGDMVDLILDIRIGSPTFGKLVGHHMPAQPRAAHSEWIWVPPGFAHGNLFLADSTTEYFCTSEYSPSSEVVISPLAEDIDWSLCEPAIKEAFCERVARTPLMSEKDRHGRSVAAWKEDSKAKEFLYACTDEESPSVTKFFRPQIVNP